MQRKKKTMNAHHGNDRPQSNIPIQSFRERETLVPIFFSPSFRQTEISPGNYLILLRRNVAAKSRPSWQWRRFVGEL
jgi:hypothetical protein